MLEAVRQRLKECRLELHPEKTKIVYCQDDDRKGQHEHIKFDFLGYTFGLGGPRIGGGSSLSASYRRSATRPPRRSERPSGLAAAATRNNQSLEDIARLVNPSVRGWVNYYGRFYRSCAHPGPQTPGACSHQVGMSEVQMAAASLHERSALAGTGSATRSSSVRFVADGDSTGDWIIRAG